MKDIEIIDAWAKEMGVTVAVYPQGKTTAEPVSFAYLQELIRAAVEANSVPDGWKLVPVEPTEAMVQKALHLDLSYMPGHEWPDRAAVYRAMLSASPAPAQQERKPMTDEEIRAAVINEGMMFTYPDLKIARAVERHHGIKE